MYFVCLYLGGLVACGHTNNIDHSESRHHKESSCWHNILRTQDLATETQGHPRVGQGLVYVSN